MRVPARVARQTTGWQTGVIFRSERVRHHWPGRRCSCYWLVTTVQLLWCVQMLTGNPKSASHRMGAFLCFACVAGPPRSEDDSCEPARSMEPSPETI